MSNPDNHTAELLQCTQKLASFLELLASQPTILISHRWLLDENIKMAQEAIAKVTSDK